MSRRTHRAESDAAVIEAAALRHLRQLENSGQDADAEASLGSWLAAAPGGPGAYEDVRASWLAAQSLADDPEVVALREQALSRLHPGRPRRLPAWAALAACLALLLVAGPILWRSF